MLESSGVRRFRSAVSACELRDLPVFKSGSQPVSFSFLNRNQPGTKPETRSEGKERYEMGWDRKPKDDRVRSFGAGALEQLSGDDRHAITGTRGHSSGPMFYSTCLKHRQPTNAPRNGSCRPRNSGGRRHWGVPAIRPAGRLVVFRSCQAHAGTAIGRHVDFDLPPMAFHQNIAAPLVNPAMSHPVSVRPRRHLPPSLVPDVDVTPNGGSRKSTRGHGWVAALAFQSEIEAAQCGLTHRPTR